MDLFPRGRTFPAGIALSALLALALDASMPHTPSNTWVATGGLTHGRAGAAATLLNDGDVIVSGGSTDAGVSASAERYNPSGGVFVAMPPMQTARARHTATLLPDGRVLVAGGVGSDGLATSAVEIYDPGSNAWTPAAPLHVGRADQTATALYDGRIVIAGGRDGALSLDTIEIYDPEAGVFALSSARLSAPRTGHATAQLYDGTLIVTGGYDGITALSSADLYDPFSDTIAAGPPLATPRFSHSATTLLSGRVLVAAGRGDEGELVSAEIYDPATNLFAPTGGSMVAGRENHQAFLLPHNNQVLIVGGTAGAGGDAVTAAEVFVEWQGTGGTFYPAPAAIARAWAAGAALSFREELTRRSGPNDGQLLLVGGSANADASRPFTSGELYGFATVATDKADYAPGSTVTIAGGGWVPGELVSLTLVEVPGGDVHALRAARADGAGRISSAEFVPDAGDEGISFFLTATGERSQAQTSFTDSVTWLNETDQPLEADFANLQFPTSFANTGGTSPTIFGRLFEAGVTPAAGPSASVTAQIGYGPPGSDPRVTAGWVWAPASFNAQIGNDDEYQAALNLPPGAYSYTFRFSFDGGASFTLGDLDGAGSNAGLTFSAAQLGTATAAPPTLSSINPTSAEQGQALGVTLTGTQFAPDATSVAVSGTGITVSNVAVADATHVTATLTVAGGAPATVRAVTVTTPGGTSGSVPFTVTGTGNPPVTWLNETDLPGEADFAVLQFPATFTNTGAPSPMIFGRVFESGVTPAAGPSASVVAQIGYGPFGSDPRVTPGWVWAPASFNAQVGNDDEYQATLTLPLGTFSYTFRFSLDGGFSFTLADLDGAGANGGLTFSAAQLGAATTTPTLTQHRPASAAQGQAVGVTLTGTHFVSGATSVAVSGPGITISSVAFVDPMHVTATFTVAGGAPATARSVTVTTPGGTSGSVPFTVTGVGNPPVTWLNETDVPGEADFAVLQFPATFTNTGAPSPAIFGRVFEAGVTEAAGPAPTVIAQIGYGPAGSDPRATPWVWAPASFNAQVGNDDEYQATLTLPPGSFSYTFRFSLDGGFSFTLADLDGAGANGGLTFSTTQLGTATGLPAAPVVTLKVNGQHPADRIVPTTGPVALTISVSPSSYTGSLSWYWIVLLNSQVLFVTPSGVSLTPAPILVAPPVVLADVPLLDLTLQQGTTFTNVFLLVDEEGSVLSGDVISAVRLPG